MLAARMKLSLLIIIISFAFLGKALSAEGRLALLIGNQGYTEAVGPLKKPHDDVAVITVALERLGFQVTSLKDAGYRAMDIAIKRYVSKLRAAGNGAIGFFYYSGHGVANADNDVNYLIPVDVEKADTDDLWFNAFDQPTIIDRLKRGAGNAVHFVIFDACRN
jgi:uncharacterized caspase-like protein